ncbi:unnamed protein product [Alopecurus aequalis]
MRRRHDLVSPSCRLSALVLLLTLSTARAQQQAQTDPSEVAALNAIFSAWSLRASPGWNISGEPCSGIAIDDTEINNNMVYNPAIKCDCSYNASTVCRIYGLKVYALDVNGQIPAELQNLTYLTTLDLAHNYLTGSLPAFIGKLTRLQYLSVGINALTGVLPSELGNLKNLIVLSISTNKFLGPLPEVVENLTKLEMLYIDSCGLSGELPSTFAKLKDLTTLWASDNDFTGKIPDYIGSLSNLQDLRLQGNNFNGPIPASLSNLVHLEYLRIGDLTGEVSSLAFVVNMTSLNILVLRNSRISDNLASVDFSKFVNLSSLDLSFNSITGKVSPVLLNLSSLNFLNLGSNNLSGSLPDISPLISTIDLSYNMLSGRLPSWVNMNNLQVNLVWNNFVMNSSNDSVLPPGLNCLQRDTPCLIGSPSYSSFAVDSGGKALIKASDNSIYEPDDASLVGASYYISNTTRWGVSNIGRFIESVNSSDGYIIRSSHMFTNTLDPELFGTARMSPSSLRYYGIGLKNAMYKVVLEFAEIYFPDNQTWHSVGKRIFDIYIQGKLEEKDFDIKTQTNGKSYSVVKKQYYAEVSNNFIEIHLFWAGKGTCCIPKQGFYGPSISALSVSSDGLNNEVDPDQQTNSTTPSRKEEKSTASKTGLLVGVITCVAVLGFLALTGSVV